MRIVIPHEEYGRIRGGGGPWAKSDANRRCVPGEKVGIFVNRLDGYSGKNIAITRHLKRHV